MNPQLLNDPRAKRWGNVAKYGAILAVGFFAAPYVWVAIGGLLGLLAAFVLITAVWMSRQWVYAVAANMRLKLIKAEAAKNPVETLQEEYRREMVKLDTRKQNIEKLKAQTLTFEDKTEDMKAKYGADDAAYQKFSKDLVILNRIYENRCTLWRKARAELDLFKKEIDRAQTIWETAQAAAAAQETSGLTEEEFFAKLRTETAFDAIHNSYNQAIASLDTALLETPQTAFIDVSSAAPTKRELAN